MDDALKQRIEAEIKKSPITLFMKGNPDFPQCGFSAGAVECLQRAGATFHAVDVLADWDIREGIKEYSSWPTIPQIYINGEFIGGFDILRDLYESGELEKLIAAAQSA
ncbi:MAG: Grx4 family monothiol glutaredoxin [Deltaproteobacteria bacterium]|nr:Grx4 family monothiol glutaredoxin [Deltaproteobacteria bacterium]